jgi:hypothetical protein
MLRLVLVSWVVIVPATPAWAQDEPVRQLLAIRRAVFSTATTSANPPIRLTIAPTNPPTPALKFALLPELRDQVPGDAAPVYKQAIEVYEKLKLLPGDRVALFELEDRWQNMPVAELPCEQVRRHLERYRDLYQLLDKAARSETCDFGLPERLRQKGIGALLPEVQTMREFARLLALRARLELAEGHPERSLRTLRLGLSMARQIGDSATVISSLVGNAIAHLLLGQLETVLTHPRTPNLYWSLTDLPAPFLDLHRPLEGERISAYGTFPGLLQVITDPDCPPFTSQQIEMLVKTALGIQEIDLKYLNRVLLARSILKKHEAAKKALIASGRPWEKVEAMPHVQAALLHAFLEYDLVHDEMRKWLSFPYYQAEPHLLEVESRLRLSRVRNDPDTPAIRLAPLLLPALNKVILARARLDRRVAALRCLEAVRLHAASHGGKWPASLEEIKQVPVPVDPITGKSFVYRLEGERALLEAPPIPRLPNNAGYALSFELTLKR